MLEKDSIERFNAEEILNEILNTENNLNVNKNLQSLQNIYDDKFILMNKNKIIKIDENYNEKQILDYVKTNNNLIVNENLPNEFASCKKNLIGFSNKFEPSCIKLDKTNDTLLIGDRDYNIIYRFIKNFELLQQYGNNNENKSTFYSITGIEVDESNGNIFICYFNDKKVQILTKDFKFIKEFTNNMKRLCDILLNKKKNELIISDLYCITIFTIDGQFIKSIGKEGNRKGEFYCLKGFIYDIVNNQYIICDFRNHRIQIVNENLKFIKSFGSKGNNQNEFKYPINLAINYKNGQIYIVDKDNYCIKIYK
ncbi:hypothetical protein ABK040_013105 [Willaertia magna]